MAESKRYAEGQREEAECRKCGQPIWIVYHGPQANHTIDPRAVTAYLDSLLGELPEESIDAAIEALDGKFADDVDRNHAWAVWSGRTSDALNAFLRSLRDSLASGREGSADG